MMRKQYSPYLPLKVGDFYKNLEILCIANSNVQHLMQGDLKGLDKLEVFDVSHNPIEQLGPDFFKGHGSIESVLFYICHMKIIDTFVLHPLEKLNSALINKYILNVRFVFELSVINLSECDKKWWVFDQLHSKLFVLIEIVQIYDDCHLL